MELISKVDVVIRRLLPTILEASGNRSAAGKLRGLDLIQNDKTICLASKTLKGIHRDLRFSHIKSTTFWCEKAVWAAAVEDFVSFRKYIDSANACIREEMYNSKRVQN